MSTQQIDPKDSSQRGETAAGDGSQKSNDGDRGGPPKLAAGPKDAQVVRADVSSTPNEPGDDSTPSLRQQRQRTKAAADAPSTRTHQVLPEPVVIAIRRTGTEQGGLPVAGRCMARELRSRRWVRGHRSVLGFGHETPDLGILGLQPEGGVKNDAPALAALPHLASPGGGPMGAGYPSAEEPIGGAMDCCPSHPQPCGFAAGTLFPDSESLAWASRQLAEIADAFDIKKRVRALSQAEHVAAVAAISVVAEHKAHAYAAAHRGERPSLDGWIAAGGPLVDAVRVLQGHLIPVEAVPMIRSMREVLP